MKNENLPDETKLKLQKKRNLSDSDLLKIEAAINLIPFAGGFLATYFGEIRSKRAQERTLQFIDYFSKKIKDLDDRKLDKKYLQSEEFGELFAQGAEEAARSTTKKRINRFANILINNALLGAESRSRTQSIMSFVDRISDLDAFVLLCFGNPRMPSLRAQSKESAYQLVQQLADYLCIKCPPIEAVIESLVYMDNLGLTWLNENKMGDIDERGKDLVLKEFSSFRTPLGDAVAAVIAPPSFYREDVRDKNKKEWPKDHVSSHFHNLGLE